MNLQKSTFIYHLGVEFSKNFPTISDINYFASSFSFFDLTPYTWTLSNIFDRLAQDVEDSGWE